MSPALYFRFEDGDTMQDGKHCPMCKADIGIWPIFSAGFPTRIRCPKCFANVGYQRIWGEVIVIVLLMTAAFVGALFTAGMFGSSYQFAVFVIVLLGIWVPVEFLIALYLRANKKLAYRSGGYPPNREDTVKDA